MNQPVLLHIVERLESLLSKLPAAIQKPILNELTPLKELFLEQRAPRFVFIGSIKKTTSELISILFELSESDASASVFRWQEVNVGGRGTISVLDARGAGHSAAEQVQAELKRQPADLIFFFDEGQNASGARKAEIENMIACLDRGDATKAKVVGVAFSPAKERSSRGREREVAKQELVSRLGEALRHEDQLLAVIPFGPAENFAVQAQQLMSILARELPNECRIEMIRISRDREAQKEVAQILVKSTAAICTAIGAQPIPLADLPILTTLQLVMVSGIMYLSGRERSLRAATEFVGALGVNVGAGMLFREGTRAILKFFPGWGNVVCGMVAGAGTYAIGRAATVFFLEGVSIKEARRIYVAARKKRAGAVLTLPERTKARRSPKK